MFPRASFFAVFDIVIVPLIRRSLILRRTSLRYLFYLQVPAGTPSTRRKFSLILDSVPSWACLIQMLRNLSRERNGRPKENLSLLVTRVSIDSVTFAETPVDPYPARCYVTDRAHRSLHAKIIRDRRTIVAVYDKSSGEFWGKSYSDAERWLSADNRRISADADVTAGRPQDHGTGASPVPDGNWIVKRKAWWVNPTEGERLLYAGGKRRQPV